MWADDNVIRFLQLNIVHFRAAHDFLFKIICENDFDVVGKKDLNKNRIDSLATICQIFQIHLRTNPSGILVLLGKK